MGCACTKQIIEETLFYKRVPNEFKKPSDEDLIIKGYFIIKKEQKYNKFYMKIYKSGKATLHMQESSPILFVMNFKKFEFQPELRLIPKQNQNKQQPNTQSQLQGVLTTSPTKKLQQKQKENYLHSTTANSTQFTTNKNMNSNSSFISSKDNKEQQLELAAIKIYFNDIFIIISSEDKENIQKLRNMLNGMIVQRGFQYQYKLVKKLGQGGFAVVYLVISRETGQKFAAKIFSKESLKEEKDGIEALQNEISIMRSIDHINLLTVHEVFSSQNSIYLIMDVHTGGTLEEKIKKKEVLSSRNVRQVTRQLLYGLEYLHQKRIMHRDIKPDNIIFKNNEPQNYQCVIADFGLSTRIDIEKYMYTKCGTPGFVAPEVWEYTEYLRYNEQCDVYSVGIIFHILLLGYSPFDDSDLQICIKKNRKGLVPWQNPEYQKLKPEALDLLKKMLTINPAKRVTPTQAIDHPYFTKNRRQTIYYQENEQPQVIDRKQGLSLSLVNTVADDSIDSPSRVNSGFQTPKLKKENLKQSFDPDFNMGKSPLLKGRDILLPSEEVSAVSPIPNQGLNSPQVFKYPQQENPSKNNASNSNINPTRQRRQSKFANQNSNAFQFPTTPQGSGSAVTPSLRSSSKTPSDSPVNNNNNQKQQYRDYIDEGRQNEEDEDEQQSVRSKKTTIRKRQNTSKQSSQGKPLDPETISINQSHFGQLQNSSGNSNNNSSQQ